MSARVFYEDKSLEELAGLSPTEIPFLASALSTEFTFRQTVILERTAKAQERSVRRMTWSVIILALTSLGTFLLAALR